MDVVSLCPLRVASLLWRPSSGGFALTLIGKATFDLRPGELRLAEQQEDANEEDNFWDDDPNRSLRAPSDLVPFKPHADVVLVGQAFAPGKVAVRSLPARISIAGLDKTIDVCGDRPFTSMQLRYERAAGGAENPVGVRAGGAQLPNLQIPGGAPGSVGFGPIAPSWPGRRAKLGRHVGSFPPRRWADTLVPEDLDASFFNVAPPDQQLERLDSGERLVLENLSPQHARLAVELPTTWPRAFVDRSSGLEELSLVCDTLWIDTDRAVCTLTWRGQIGLHGPGDEGRVSFLLDQPSRPLSWPEIQRRCARRPSQPQIDDSRTAADGYVPEAEGTRQYVVKPREPSRSDGALPFVSNATSDALPLVRPAMSSIPPWLEHQATPVPAGLGGETLMPGALRVPVSWPRQDAPRPLPPLAPLPPPAPVPAPVALPPPPPHVEPPPPAPPPPLAPAVIATPTLLGVTSGVLPAPVVAVPEPPAPASVAVATYAAPARPSPAETVDLIWFDPTTPDRVRIHLPWQELVAKLRPVPPEPEQDADPDVDPPEVVDRRDVFNVLTDADPTSLDDLDACLAAATSPRGAFTPALALVSGELELTFDDVKTLEVLVAVVAPFAAGPDKKLKEAFDAAGEALASPFLKASSRSVDGLITRLRDTFAQGSWSLPAGWLDQQVERSLVEQRRYQKRSLLGESWIRALLGPRGAGVPAYLPEALAGKLPLYARFPARLVVEVHLQQDEYESHPAALRCLALARVIPARAAARATPRTPAKASAAR